MKLAFGSHIVKFDSCVFKFENIKFSFCESQVLICEKDGLSFAFIWNNESTFKISLSIYLKGQLLTSVNDVTNNILAHVDCILCAEKICQVVEGFCDKYSKLKSEFKESLLNKTSD